MMFNRRQNNNINPLAYQVKRRLKKALFAFLKPYLVPIIAFSLVLLLASSLVSTVYTQLTGGQTLVSMGTEPTGRDKEIKEFTIGKVDEVNILDTWVDGKNINELVDAYGRDRKLALTWGQVYSIVSYDEMANRENIKEEKLEKVAKDLHPKFNYMTSTKIVESYSEEHGWKVTSKVTEYLLTSADTILGNYKFTYERVTETDDDTRITYHQPKETKLEGRQYERLENYLKDELKIEDIDMDFQVRMILEAGEGYDREREQMEWLIDTGNASSYFISRTSIPPDLMPIIKAMSEKYDMPVWFLTGLIWVESKFDSLAINTDSGAIGLMQVMPDNWESLASKLGYDVEADKPNPKAQIEIGINVLLEHVDQSEIDRIDWDSRIWETQMSPALAFYGGYGYSENSVNEASGYLGEVFKYSYEFKKTLGQKVWPTPGYYEITSPFGWRVHPLFKTRRHHDGIDIGAPYGANAISVTNGKVVFAGSYGAYGNTVVVRDMMHDYLYAHLSSFNVSVGDEVQVGDTVGYVGSTGVSTGPHLHFGVAIGNFREDNWIEPLLVLSKE